MPLSYPESDSFEELHTQKEVLTKTVISRGNIIKESDADTVQPEAEVTAETDDMEIILHKSGDLIESIEVRCTCGKSTTIKLDYGGD